MFKCYLDLWQFIFYNVLSSWWVKKRFFKFHCLCWFKSKIKRRRYLLLLEHGTVHLKTGGVVLRGRPARTSALDCNSRQSRDWSSWRKLRRPNPELAGRCRRHPRVMTRHPHIVTCSYTASLHHWSSPSALRKKAQPVYPLYRHMTPPWAVELTHFIFSCRR